MRDSPSESAFEEYVAARQAPLLRYAYLLCGNWHQAEDATSVALTKLYLHWPRIRRHGAEDAYARTVLRRVLIDESRRPWRRHRVTDQVPETAAPAGPAYEEQAALLEALMGLPLKQRQCVALRFWLDRSVEDTAAELGISAGSVKTHTHRGLQRLRTTLTLEELPC